MVEPDRDDDVVKRPVGLRQDLRHNHPDRTAANGTVTQGISECCTTRKSCSTRTRILRSLGFCTAVILTLPFSFLPIQSGAQVDLAQLTSNVLSVTAAPGAPGPLFPLTDDWVPVVTGDADASFPSVFVMARAFGSGRVVVIGHTGPVIEVASLDNGEFMGNVFSWLDGLGRRQVLYSAGHGESITALNIGGVSNRLAMCGFSVEPLRSPIDAPSLAQCGVILIGNAKNGISETEEDAIVHYVSQGGGLCLAGAGWTPPSLQEWRMTALGERFQMRWLSGSVDDPTDRFENSPLFHTFGNNNVNAFTPQGARRTIAQMHATFTNNLAEHIQTNAEDCLAFVRAHRLLSLPTIDAHEFPIDHPLRLEIAQFYRDLAESNAVFYSRVTPFPEETASHAAWVRERFWRTWADILPLTSERKAQILAASAMTGARADTFLRHGVMILDNMGLDDAALQFIRDLLDVIPPEMHDLHAITVKDYFGEAPDPEWVDRPGTFVHQGAGQSPNTSPGLFNYGTNHNSFPPDVAPVPESLFCAITIHEVNHTVTAHWLVPSASLLARRDQLIADAGTNHMNYLRSTIPDGAFVAGPQEFFASISQQWFADSEKTMELGLLRHAAGFPDPINQALFFADVYSQDTDSTWFYRSSNIGSIVRYAVPLSRNASGHIVGIATNGRWLDFDVDQQGRVLSFRESFRILHALLPGAIELTFPTAASRTYTVYGSRNLNGTLWEPLHEFQELNGGMTRVSFSVTTDPNRLFLRVRESRP